MIHCQRHYAYCSPEFLSKFKAVRLTKFGVENSQNYFTMDLKDDCSLPLFLFFFHSVLVQWFQKSQTVFETLKQFVQVLNTFWKSQTQSRKSHTVSRILRQFSEISSSLSKSLRQFREVLNTFQKFQTLLGSLKYFSGLSNNSRKTHNFFSNYQTVVESVKCLLGILNSSRSFKTVLGSLQNFSVLSNSSRKPQKIPEKLKLVLEV